MELRPRPREPRCRNPLAFAGPKALACCAALLLNAGCTPSAASARPAPVSDETSEPPHADSTAPDAPRAPDTASTPMRPSEASLLEIIEAIQHAGPLTDQLDGPLAEAVGSPRFRRDVVNLGAVESVVFKGADREAFELYEVTSKTGFSEWRIKLGPDGKASGLWLRVLEKPPSQPLTEAQFVAELEKRMRDAATEDEFSGAVLVARGGTPIFQKALGLADREQGIPNQLNTKFRIGSMNKMFTAVVILQLVQAGKIALSDPLGKYLKGYPNADVAQQVTIEHLLTHTGGTGDIFGPEYDEHKRELRRLGDYVKLHGQRGLQFSPGSQWSYSNYGFVLLGVVIEKVTGQSYYDYVARHVYEPAGMKNTGAFAEDQNVPLRSVGYMRFRAPGTPPNPGAKWFPNSTTLPYRGTSAGGGYSTVGDLLAFANALEQHRLLDAKHTELLTTAKPHPSAPGNSYAYGFADQTRLGVRCYGHGGGAPGMNGELFICRSPGAEQSFVIATLANLDPPAASKIAEYARVRLPTAAEPASASAAAPCRELVLDDLEDGDERSSGSAGASGAWNSFKDPNGSTLSPEPFTAAPGGAAGSKHAAHIAGKTGKTRMTWAAMELEAQGSTPYDLSAWKRVCFRAKGSGGRARFNVVDVNTTPKGGVCTECYNNFGAFFELAPSWQEHCFAFDELTQMMMRGEPLPEVVEEKAYALIWAVHAPDVDYDLWIDDVRLVCH